MKIAQDTAKMLGLPPIQDEEVILDDRFNAGVYGLADQATLGTLSTHVPRRTPRSPLWLC